MTATRIVRALALGAGLAAATASLTWGLLFYRPLPTIDGYYRFLGLHERGEVVRDVFGIPRIYARDVHDLFFLQGYVTAQDRLAQMDATRAWARSIALDTVIGSRDRSEAVTLALEAYAAGVNKLIEQHAEARALPGELVLAGRRPAPWRTDDSARIAIVHFLGSPGASVCVSAPASVARKGGALLAAELHADAPSPGWYEIGLDAGTTRAVGLSLPGVPGIVAGHNGRSAWAALPTAGIDPYGAMVDLLDAMDAGTGVRADPPRDLACHTQRAGVIGEGERVARIRAAAIEKDLDIEALRMVLGRSVPSVGARLLIDLADVDTSRSAVSHGASGQRASPHFDDQAPLWELGQAHRLPFTRGAIGRTDGELVLRAR